MNKFIKGVDLSTMAELERLGAKYYNHGVEGDVLDILMEYGINAVRLRVWHNPYSETGEPYGAGTNDLATTIQMAKKVRSKGLDFLLDIHYSDFWTDPGKQIKPKAWKDYSVSELEQAMYDYTVEVMEALVKADAAPTMVQVGNELSNGILWPEGEVPNYDNLARFVSAGIRGVKAVIPDMPIMIHLDNGGNNELYRRWFDNYCQRGEDFDVIGLSYYPFWHGSLDSLSNNMKDIAKRYNKELIIAEVSMGYTMEDYASYEKLGPEERKGMATKPSLVEKIEYPMTKQGQSDFMLDIMKRLKEIPENKGCGFYYWEPAWIPVAGSGWATEASLKYMQDKGPCGNEWANQALFDYEGNALPALEVIRDFKG
ncbi:glycoside hydrolase family 53 protein [Roseburia sp. 499]|uniref:glycoside hydrolase family 53 protein n=1 Tax=Roseburia sp. 499 TaxID=1261634 RepID=UPI0009511B8D|nr:glycosyl hydrolase 53 family protein [Roseburia sp. 499]WVK70677.1 glycosyl hydrolase 53 family protein [Roseburia sp. 499]